MSLQLNIGAGHLRLPGFIGVDFQEGAGVDVRWDLTNIPWPFPGGAAKEVRAWHVLEHLPGYSLDNAMREVARILAPGGLLYVKVPYREPGPYNPFHFHVFDKHSFDAWVLADRDWPPHYPKLFQRRKQEIVSTSGFPLWHLNHYLPRLGRILVEEDERGPWARFPGTGLKELREWLVKPASRTEPTHRKC